jgi:hypothetical protein
LQRHIAIENHHLTSISYSPLDLQPVVYSYQGGTPAVHSAPIDHQASCKPNMSGMIPNVEPNDTSSGRGPPPFSSIDRSNLKQTHTFPCPELLQQALGYHKDERDGLHVIWVKIYRYGESKNTHEYATVKVSYSQEAEDVSFFIKIERNIIYNIGEAIDQITLSRDSEESLDLGDVSLTLQCRRTTTPDQH